MSNISWSPSRLLVKAAFMARRIEKAAETALKRR